MVRSEYKNDKNTVIDFYNSKGYRDAEITYDSIYTDKNGISIEIGINEGQKYYFRDIDWSGNFTYNDEILDRILVLWYKNFSRAPILQLLQLLKPLRCYCAIRNHISTR